jgi:hypothetical protein
MATELDNAFKAIPAPTTANFSMWQKKVRLLLSNAGIWSIVMPVDPVTGLRPLRPVPYNANAPSPAEREEAYRYDKSRAKAVAAIAAAAGDNYLDMATEFIDNANPGGLWDELETRLATRTGPSRFNAIYSFFTISRLAGELWGDLAGRIGSARTRVQALFPANFTLKDFLDELESFQLLRSFPEDSVTRTTILAQGNLDPAHVKAMVDLLITAPSNTVVESATLATSPPGTPRATGKFPACGWCNQTNHPESNCFSKNDYHALFIKERAEGIRRGRDGQILKSGEPNASGSRRGKNGRRNFEHAKVADTPEETAGIASSFTSLADPNANLWTLDSGASRHMTPRRDWFQSLRADRRSIKVADGRCVYSAGIGIVMLRSTPSGVAFRLYGVLYVPDLNANLVSTNQLSPTQGLRITTFGNLTEFIRRRKVLFSATTRSNNLSYLDVATESSETATHAFSEALPATPQRWHERWAHAGVDLLKELRTSGAIKGFKVKKGPEVNDVCEPCIEGKMHRAPHTAPAERADKPLGRVSSDVKGPLPTRSRSGNQYWIVFMDQFTGLAAVYFMREKGEATSKFLLYKAWAENQLSTTIKNLRDDKGGEYKSNELQEFTDHAGIHRERTIRDTPEQNGQAERFNRTLSEGITAMLSQAQLPPSMWQDAASAFVHMHNRKPSKSRGMKSPYELWYGRVPSVGHFRVWGCLAYVHLQRDQRAALGPHALKCVFIRYAHDAKGWVFWDTGKRKEIVSDSAVFDEDYFPGTLTGKIPRRVSDITPLDDEDQPVLDDAEPAPAAPAAPPPAPPALDPEPAQQRDDADPGGGENSPARSVTPPAPAPIRIRIPGAIERAEIRRRAAEERAAEMPREVRALMDRSHFGTRHDDADLPPRRGNRPAPREGGFIVEVDDDGNELWDKGVEVSDKASSGDLPPHIPHFVPFPSLPSNPSFSIPIVSAVDFALSTSSSIEPKSLKEALTRPDADKYIAAAIAEIEAHMENKTWELCRLPAGKKAIGSRWVFKIKRNADGSVERYKGRIVAKGYAQRQGVDYTDTFAPTARFAALRSVIALAAIEDLELESVDISTAFLNGEIDSEVYMEVPEGVEVDQSDGKWVVKLLKGLYGIKQGPRIWARKLHKELVEMGFNRLECDHSVFIYMRGNVRIIVPVHVDDLLLASNNKKALTQFKTELGKRFKIRDLGPVEQILGIHLERDRPNRTISLSQTRYIEDMIREVIGDTPFNGTHIPMDDVKLTARMGPNTKEQEELMQHVDYRALVGKLLYLSIATRPDISYAVGVLCRFNDNPGPQHWDAAKKVLRYLQQTKKLKLVYSPSDSLEPFVVFSDADLGGDPDTTRSTAGYVTRIGSGAVSWGSRLQRHTSLSSTEAEYTTASAAGTELMWMRYFLEECGYDMTRPSTLLIDNASAIQVAKNPEHQSTMKHVHREYRVRVVL